MVLLVVVVVVVVVVVAVVAVFAIVVVVVFSLLVSDYASLFTCSGICVLCLGCGADFCCVAPTVVAVVVAASLVVVSAVVECSTDPSMHYSFVYTNTTPIKMGG